MDDKIEETPKAAENHEDDKSILESMGFQRALIDKIYSSMHPNTIEDALDYLNKNDNDKFTHSYIPNNLNLCTICGCGRSSHANSEIIEPLINNNINININNINQDDSEFFGIDGFYDENNNNNELINPIIQQLQQNPGMTIDTLTLNLNSVISNEKDNSVI